MYCPDPVWKISMSPLSRLTVAGSGDAVQLGKRVTFTFIAFLHDVVSIGGEEAI
jgi:hypothetical protein